MDETIIFPSPNWYQSSILAVSKDGWLMYGSIAKSLCILKPLQTNADCIVEGNQGYQAYHLNKAHNDKIVTVDISPEWPTKKCILTGSADGIVKQWTLEQIDDALKINLSHTNDHHQHHREEVSGVGYCNNDYAVTVGNFGHIVKWDLNSNVLKTFNNILKNFRPTCLSCSPHIHLNVAVGTKQGVVFVLDLNGAARVLYKVRGHDDEIIKVSWCPQYEVVVKKMLKEIQARSVATERMKKIRQEPENPEVMKELDERVKKGAEVEHFMTTHEKTKHLNDSENVEEKVFDESASSPNVTQVNESEKALEETAIASNVVKETINKSGAAKTLPEDSFDDTAVKEDDMFDIYKDHEADEFGHKKYQPVDIIVKVKEEKEEDDYMAECSKLKEDILKRKEQATASVSELVEAMDKAVIDREEQEGECNSEEKEDGTLTTEKEDGNNSGEGDGGSSAHIHKHLLASVGRHGSVKIWSKSGKAVGSGMLPHVNKQKQQKSNNTTWATLLWYKPDVLVLADCRSQLQQCNPLKIDCKNKVHFKVIHTNHKRGLYAISTNAPRVITPEMLQDPTHDDNWYIYTTAQDRDLIKYSLKNKCVMSTNNTAGGFVYMIETCPYDAGKIAIAVGDGAVRVWETTTSDDNESKLKPGKVYTYWQNVMGKVITVAWHPTIENLLAFATGEARVGLIDVSGKTDYKSAKVLQSALSGGVYSLCWGEGNDLYASASGKIVVYDTANVGEAPSPLKVEVEGNKWELSAVKWDLRGLVVGSLSGAVAVLTCTKPHDVTAVAFVFNKMIFTLAWHPLETSSATEESPYKNHIAVCSYDKVNTIVILDYQDKEDGTKQLSTYRTLSGHKSQVLQIAWNPHEEATLLSTSSDRTVRVWNTATGECTSIFGNHSMPTFCAGWGGWPSSPAVMSGGADGTLRLWNSAIHSPQLYDETKFTEELTAAKKQKKKKEKKDKAQNADDDQSGTEEGTAVLEIKIRANKKFLLPMCDKQINTCNINALKMMLKKHVELMGGTVIESLENIVQQDVDFVKLFGTMNEINDLLDTELERHQDMGSMEAYAMLCIFRGHIDVVVQHAVKRDILDTFLLSVTPSVSHMYWKEVTQLYLAQIDRLIAKSADASLNSAKSYGGPVYRKAAALLNLHDVIGAVNVLTEAKLFKEAYVLCRTRYIDSVAEDTLLKWAKYCHIAGNTNMTALCYIALGNLTQAITILAQSTSEDILRLAADIAKVIGQKSFASHIDKKREEIKGKYEANTEANTEDVLESLPTRAEIACNEDLQVLLKEIDAKMEALLRDKANENNGKDSETGNQDNVTNVKENVTDVKDYVTDFKNDATYVKDNVTEVKDSVTDVKYDVTEVQDGSTGVKENVTGVKDDVTDVNQNETGLKEYVTDVKENVTDVKDNVTDVKDNEPKVLEELENNPNANNVTEV